MLYFCENSSREVDGTHEIIRRRIIEMGRGKIFVAQDFTMIASQDSIRQALCVLTDERFIVRLARGVYCFPRVYGEYSINTALPTPESIAEAVAERSCCRIVPYGEQAAYLMGFTTLQMGRYTYLTDGAPKRICLGAPGTITFRHSSEVRIFSFKSRTMQLLSLAMRAYGEEEITPKIRSIIANRLTSVPPKEFEEDIKLCPAWVQDIIFDL